MFMFFYKILSKSKLINEYHVSNLLHVIAHLGYLDDESWQRAAVKPAYSDTGQPLPPLSCDDYRVWSCPALLCPVAGCAVPPSHPL